MCGFFGLVTRAQDGVDLEGVLRSLAHRGPDGSGTFRGTAAGRRCTLAHTRLAVIDLSEGGHQPRSSADGRYTIAFNGEIYNHREVRGDLERAGRRFTTTSDTEVLVEAFAEWGPACLSKLRGMFAFAIWDALLGTIFLARDRLGIKPLYVTRTPNGIAFASEVRTLLKAGLGSRSLSQQGLYDYLTWGSAADPTTLVEGVESVLPGTYVEADGTCVRSRAYWQPRATSKPPGSVAEAVERIRPVLGSAVTSHLVADVPVGVFLSGGIDSSVITALARAASSGELHTFSIGLEEDAMGESPHAEAVARAIGTTHHSLPLSGVTVREDLDEALAALDQPSGDGINTYFVARAVRRAGLKVVLSGLGGDEIFAGYDHFRNFGRLRQLTGLLPAGAAPKLLAGLRRFGPRALRGREAKLAALLTAPRADAATYAVLRSMFTPTQVATLLPDARVPLASAAFVPAYLAEQPHRAIDSVNLFSVLELTNYLRNTLLRDSDSMSMAHGLELRVPFLDHLLVEELLAIPGPMKLSDEVNKPLLVAAAPTLPRAAVYRKKMGFQLPFDAWLRGALKPKVEALLLEGALTTIAGLRSAEVEHMWRSFQMGSRDINATRIWSLVALSFWCDRNLRQA
jgi:asparagine synthase (glutamine-hydrolysing)